MKVSAVSGDLVVELALVAGVGLALYLVAKKLTGWAGSAVDAVKSASDAVALNTMLPDTAYADPAAQAQATAILNPGGDNVVAYYWHKLTGASPSPSTGGATGSW